MLNDIKEISISGISHSAFDKYSFNGRKKISSLLNYSKRLISKKNRQDFLPITQSSETSFPRSLGVEAVSTKMQHFVPLPFDLLIKFVLSLAAFLNYFAKRNA